MLYSAELGELTFDEFSLAAGVVCLTYYVENAG
jgi:hypothetical protein